MWNEGAAGKPRLTIMPSPSPARPWQGAQYTLNRSCPRSSSASVSGGGGCASRPRGRRSPARRPACRVAALVGGRPSCRAGCFARLSQDRRRAPPAAERAITAQPPHAGTSSIRMGPWTRRTGAAPRLETGIRASTQSRKRSWEARSIPGAVEDRMVQQRHPAGPQQGDSAGGDHEQERDFDRGDDESRPTVERPPADIERISPPQPYHCSKNLPRPHDAGHEDDERNAGCAALQDLSTSSTGSGCRPRSGGSPPRAGAGRPRASAPIGRTRDEAVAARARVIPSPRLVSHQFTHLEHGNHRNEAAAAGKTVRNRPIDPASVAQSQKVGVNIAPFDGMCSGAGW